MKKIISAVLSAAMVLSCASFNVMAETTSTTYTLDATAKKVSGVAPLTTVSTFKSNFTGDAVEVINVDGTVMTDGYATENVFAKIGGELYEIETKALYQPIKDKGEALEDGTVYYEMAANTIAETVNSSFGFNRYGAFDKFGIGSDTDIDPDTDGKQKPANTADQTLKVSKITYGGEAVYKIENDSARYAYLRTHTGDKTKLDTQLRKDTESYSYVVTNYKFTADKLGNISVFHGMPTMDASSGNVTNYDAHMSAILGYARVKYAGNALHFLEDGKIWVGGNYENDTVSNRQPYHQAGEWTANTEYNVSIVQKSNLKNREHRVAGIYINGEKVFPTTAHTGDGNGLSYYTDGLYRMYGYSSPYYAGISSVRFATAPKDAGENLTVNLSDFNVYGLNNIADFNQASTKQNVSLANAENIVVSEEAALITDSVAETVAEFKEKYANVIMGIYNADGTMVADDAYLASEMTVKIASADGLQGKTYKLKATEPLVQDKPDTTVYTVDTDAKTVSNVKPLTKVADFLANFKNGSIMKVVNIDGSEMDANAYATENVTLVAPNGDAYAINVKYVYSPIQDSGAALVDGTELYKDSAKGADYNEITEGGFARLHVYEKIGYGKDSHGPENTETQKVKGTKQTVNGEAVYVMENDSNKYTYMKSHYPNPQSDEQTELYKAFGDVWKLGNTPIVTTVEFEADKYGNISLFNNTPVRNSDKENSPIENRDSGMDTLIYGAEITYAANSVHFLEDGSVKLGGIYSDHYPSYRKPSQETDFTWEPGKKYTVSIVQRCPAGSRYGYVDGVYVNGEKIFPHENALKHADGRVGYVNGEFRLWTRGDSTVYGGGLSSIMIGTAPKVADENMKVELSDVKVYTTSSFNPAKDTQIALTTSNPKVEIDNDNAVISCMDVLSENDIDTTDVCIKLEGDYMKVVSADGLASKTYKIVSENVRSSFLNGENGPEIDALSQAGNSVCFVADVDATSLMDGTEAAVILAVYDKETQKLNECVIATGVKYADEITRYKAVMDISAYDKSEIEIRGFVWDGFESMDPLSQKVELK